MDSASVHPLPSRDPVSGGRLVITELEGPETGITIRGRFEMPRFAELTPDQSRYLETFLRCRGMLNSVERELGISYPTARARLDAVLRALDLHEVREDNGSGPEASESEAPETPAFEPVSFEPPFEEAAAPEPIVTEPVSADPIAIETIFDEPVAPFEPVVGEPPAIEEADWQATAPEGTIFENAAFEEPVEEETEPRRSRDEILTLLERGEITPDEAKRELAK